MKNSDVMKYFITLLYLITYMVYGQKAKAQVPCEFDTIFGGQKILETRSKQYIVASVGGYSGDFVNMDNPSLKLLKVDACGNKLWEKVLEAGLSRGGVLSIIGIIEEDNGEILVSANYYNTPNLSVPKPLRGIRFIKTDSNGNVKWKNMVGDTSHHFQIYDFIKLNSNSYLFTGRYYPDYLDNQLYTTAFASDTFGHIVFQFDSTGSKNPPSAIYKAYLQANKDILLLGIYDSSFSIATIDSIGIKKKSQIISSEKNHGINSIALNYDHTEIIVNGLSAPNNSCYLARYSLDGGFIWDSIFSDLIFKNSGNISLGKNINLFVGKSILLTDLNFKIIWNESHKMFLNGAGFIFYNNILGSDQSIISVGMEELFVSMSKYKYNFLMKTSIIKYVKSILVIGGNKIEQKGGTLQLKAVISPANVADSGVSWSVNDTSKAQITQTGLVIAKADGNIIVAATSMDGSNVVGTKSISITNQNVGILEGDNLKPVVSVYPNPADKFFDVEVKNSNLQKLSLYSSSGILIYEYSITNMLQDHLQIPSISFTNGIYLLRTETDNGIIQRKIIVNR